MPKKIEKITAFVSVDKNGDEGILGQKLGDTWLPFVAADMARLMSLYPKAMEFFLAQGIEFRILEFSVRTDVTDQYV